MPDVERHTEGRILAHRPPFDGGIAEARAATEPAGMPQAQARGGGHQLSGLTCARSSTGFQRFCSSAMNLAKSAGDQSTQAP
jgi:hypothetical protein